MTTVPADPPKQIGTSIARRLILNIILFSSFITLAGTTLQLYLDYSHDIKNIESNMNQIELSYLQSIINSLWVTDDELLRIQAEGILRLPDMQFIEVTNQDKVIYFAGTRKSENIIQKEFQLYYTYKNQDLSLGTLLVAADLNAVYRRLLNRFFVILTTQAIKTFLVSMFIFFLFYYLVGRHLQIIARYTADFNPNEMAGKLNLTRQKPSPGKADELDELVSGLNQMRQNLIVDIEERENAELTIQTLVKSTVRTKGQECFDSVTTEICNWLGVDCSIIAVVEKDNSKSVSTLSMRLDGEFIEDFSYPLYGSPCQRVINEGYCLVSEKVTELFPHDKELRELKAEAYAGTRILGENGEVLGILNGISRKKMQFPREIHKVFDVISTKIASEIERKITEEELVQHRDHLEYLVKERTIELEKEIIERKKVEVEQRLLSKIAANMSEGVFLVRAADGVILYTNPCFEAMFGYEKGEMIGIHASVVNAPGELTPEETVHEKIEIIKKHGTWSGEIRNIKKNGTPFWCYVSASLFDHPDYGQIVIAVHTDIESRKQAEASHRESENRLKSFYKAAFEGIAITEKGVLLDFNDQFAKLTGFERESLKGMEALNLVHDDDKELVLNNMRSGFEQPYEHRITHKDGSTLFIEIHSQGTVFQGRQARVTAIRDITLQKQVEKTLKDAKDIAVAANYAKSEFLANISHELRNPMHHILSYSKYGVNKIETVPTSKLHHYFKQISTSGQRLMHLLNDLLDFSKMEARRMTYKMKANDLNKIAREVIEEFSTVATEQTIAVEFKSDSKQSILTCDEYRISQVIRNLLSNSFKYSPEGMTIRVSLQKDKIESINYAVSAIRFDVIDEGVGIPEDELDYVFDKFTQSTKTKTGAGGTGLGLAICHEIIKAHKGKIWAENNKNGGATLSFLLPSEP